LGDGPDRPRLKRQGRLKPADLTVDWKNTARNGLMPQIYKDPDRHVLRD
jgi:hypothetical protein